MRTFRPTDSPKRARLPRDFLHNTYTVPSNLSGNYEGDLTMFQQHPTPTKRHLTFRSDSEEEYSDTSRFDESRKTVETLRNRLFLYELSPDTSKFILQNVVYQKLVQLITIVIFLIALVMLSAFQLFKQSIAFVAQRRSLHFEWNKNTLLSSMPIVATLAVGYCYFHCQSTCYDIH